MPTNPACQTFRPLLSPFIDGELPVAARTQVERHMAACKDCTMRVADLRAESGLLRVGMEMLADEVDFKDFSTKVLARVTPEKPPFLERIKLSLQELFLHQRGPLLAGFATAMAALVVTVSVLTRQPIPEGYAQERMAVKSVAPEQGKQSRPEVLKTKSGNAIIWLVDTEQAPEQPGTGGEAHEEVERDAPPENKLREPNGGEL